MNSPNAPTVAYRTATIANMSMNQAMLELWLQCVLDRISRMLSLPTKLVLGVPRSPDLDTLVKDASTLSVEPAGSTRAFSCISIRYLRLSNMHLRGGV